MRSVFQKGLFQLMSSALMALLQLVQIGAIARSFDGPTLGVVALYLMVISIATVFCDFGLQSYVIQDKRSQESTAADVAAVLPLFVLAALGLCAVGIFLALEVAGSHDVANTLLWIAPAVPLAIFVGPLQGFAVRELRLERLALAEAVGKAAGVGVTVVLARYGHLASSVMIGFYVALVLKLMCMHSDVARLVRLMSGSGRTRGQVRTTTSYALAQVLGQVANVFAAKADEMIVAATMPLAVFGIYASMKQLVVQAVSFISPMVRRTTMPLFSALRRGGASSPWTFEQLVGWSNAIYIGFFLVLALNSHIVTRLLYGRAFSGHEAWLAWVAVVWSLRTFAGGTISAFLQSTGAPFVDLSWTALQAAAQTVVLLAMSSHGIGAMLAAAALVHAALGVTGHVFVLGKRAEISTTAIVSKLLGPVAAYYLVALSLWFVERRLDVGWFEPAYGVMLVIAIVAMTAWVSGSRRSLFGVETT